MKRALLPTVEEIKGQIASVRVSTPRHRQLRKEMRKALNRLASTTLRNRNAREAADLKEKVVNQEREIENLKVQNRWLADQLLFSKELRSENGYLTEQLLLFSEEWFTSKQTNV